MSQWLLMGGPAHGKVIENNFFGMGAGSSIYYPIGEEKTCLYTLRDYVFNGAKYQVGVCSLAHANELSNNEIERLIIEKNLECSSFLT